MIFRRIRWRIATLYAILILLLTGGAYILLADYVRDMYLTELAGRMLVEARLVAEDLGDEVAAAVAGPELDALVAHFEAVLDARVTVVTREGLVLADSEHDRATMESHLTRPEIQQALAHGSGSSTRFSETLQDELMYVAVTAYDRARAVGVLRVARPLRTINAEVHLLRRRLTVVMVGATLVALLLALWIAERTARPARVLTEVVQRLADGDLGARLIPTTRDEIGMLTKSFNEMGDRLQGMVTDLQAERQRLASVLEHMADGVLIVDDSGAVQLINPAAERMLGLGALAAPGTEGAGVQDESSAEVPSPGAPSLGGAAPSLAQLVRHHEIVELWQRCRADGQEQAGLVQMDRENTFLQVIASSLRGTSLHPTPSGSGSAPVAAVAAKAGRCLLILQDLTRLRKLETMRRDLISNISHELRTPLTSLKVLADTLLDGALDDPPAARRFVERIHTEVESLAQMVDELLELSRIESGQVPVQLVPVAVADIVTPPVERLREQAQRAGLELSVELTNDLPPVLADVERIQQVVTNIVHNAIKFTPTGGLITVTAQTHSQAVGGGHLEEVMVSIRDTGVGIPADLLPRIFERFFRADRARTGKGTGLGLAIAKHLVQAHGGRIWAESHEGKGSVFVFTLLAAV